MTKSSRLFKSDHRKVCSEITNDGRAPALSIVMLLLSALFTCSAAPAEKRWTKLATVPYTLKAVFDSDRAGDNNWKLSFPTAEVGYATIISYQAPDDEARGYVVKTTDAGETWHRLVVIQDKEWIPYGINFLDESRGWVGGSTGGYETRDGGKTWHATQMGLSTNKIRFVKQSDGGVTAFAIGQDLYRFDVHLQPENE